MQYHLLLLLQLECPAALLQLLYACADQSQKGLGSTGFAPVANVHTSVNTPKCRQFVSIMDVSLGHRWLRRGVW
jgi:hypothetical protein